MAENGWGPYRRGWRTAVVILAALGLLTAVVFVGWSTNLVAFLMGGTLVASVHLSIGLAQEKPPSELVRVVLQWAARAGACVVAIVGYATAIGIGTLWLLVLIAVTSPALVSRLWPQAAGPGRRPEATPKPPADLTPKNDLTPKIELPPKIEKAKPKPERKPKPDRKPRPERKAKKLLPTPEPPPPPEPVAPKSTRAGERHRPQRRRPLPGLAPQLHRTPELYDGRAAPRRDHRAQYLPRRTRTPRPGRLRPMARLRPSRRRATPAGSSALAPITATWTELCQQFGHAAGDRNLERVSRVSRSVFTLEQPRPEPGRSCRDEIGRAIVDQNGRETPRARDAPVRRDRPSGRASAHRSRS